MRTSFRVPGKCSMLRAARRRPPKMVTCRSIVFALNRPSSGFAIRFASIQKESPKPISLLRLRWGNQLNGSGAVGQPCRLRSSRTIGARAQLRVPPCLQNGQPRPVYLRSGLSFVPSSRLVSAARSSSFGKRTRKPNSVYAVIPLGAALPRTLISDLPGGFGNCQEPPYRIGPMRNQRLAPGPGFPPYLVLLRVGFTLPPSLLAERCALTAPFHPYRCEGQTFGRVHQLVPGSGGMFSVALAVHGFCSPRPGRYPAHCPAEFGLSSPGNPRLHKDFRQRPPGPPARL